MRSALDFRLDREEVGIGGAGGDVARELPGITEHDGQGRLPADPETAVAALAHLVTLARQGSRAPDVLIAELHTKVGGDRVRLDGLLAWLLRTRVARLDANGALSLHPGTHLQDLAYRLSAWAGEGGFARGRALDRDSARALSRWTHDLLKAATSHPDALRRASADPDAARAWVLADWPDVDPLDAQDLHQADPLTVKLRAILTTLDSALLERRVHVRAVLLALLAGQHALLLGPPGTAKSLLARTLCSAFHDARYFEYLLSRFTHPDELFGPVSIPGLKDEDYRRLTEGFLPDAHVAFLDEVFKANSAILNSLLTLINERVFHHGRHRDPAPLLGVIGASNELPATDAGLEALYDRFLVRLAVPPLGDPAHFLQVATGDLQAPVIAPEHRLTLDEVADLRRRSRSVIVPADVKEALAALWAHAREQSWPVSDRRWRQAVQLLQVAAASDGRDRVAPVDLLLLEPCLAWDPSEAASVREALVAHLRPASAPEHDLGVQWGLLWFDRVGPTPDDPLPPGDPPMRWKERIPRRLAAVDRFLVHHERALATLSADRLNLEASADSHLWLDRLPVALLEPHLEAARELAGWLSRAEVYRSHLTSPDNVVDAVLGWLPAEERVRPEHMDLVLRIGDAGGVGYAYRQWRRLDTSADVPGALALSAETFLDWLDGSVPHARLLHGTDVKRRRALEHALPVLHEALVRHRVPEPAHRGP